ncbi:GNAT family N-acetyltransferase [Bifidobacterium sp. ESL0682]|uniref:GNAT family N-acetyltransferase n=1 Tax=Bifidobacterium sp. ESL0682 TaxID=2983212 RepID=UPI0023F78A0D|nr:GNAT family N-acetyltransferase [Bifidobacterium sp. ESL0682]WEV42497.1 GNAT family N-acetyltransferase [Bifidobacterium sp. ESL0682]
MIRAAVDNDLQAITDIYNEAVVAGGSTADLTPRTLEQRREWVSEHEPRHDFPVVVLENESGEVVGFGSLSRFHPRAGYDGIVELSYYIATAAQHQGYGTQMVSWLLDKAKELGNRKAIGLIFASNTGSIALMNHFGFTRYGFLPQACWDGHGYLDMSYWYLDL